jgi:hypothetical protein
LVNSDPGTLKEYSFLKASKSFGLSVSILDLRVPIVIFIYTIIGWNPIFGD